MSVFFIQILFDVFMAFPADILFLLYQKLPVLSAVGVVAIRANTGPEGAV